MEFKKLYVIIEIFLGKSDVVRLAIMFCTKASWLAPVYVQNLSKNEKNYMKCLF